jgi:hypothetical protein
MHTGYGGRLASRSAERLSISTVTSVDSPAANPIAASHKRTSI